MKHITIEYDILLSCTKKIEVPEDFKIKSKYAEDIYNDLCISFPEEDLSSIEEGLIPDEDDIFGSSFISIACIDVREENGKFIQEYWIKKKKRTV